MRSRYQIDYMSDLRYVISPAYRAKIHHICGQSFAMKLLYMIISIIVVISALLFLALAIQGLLR
jgi:uncharacterized membrane protein